jgi:DNA-binding CsgD family transcriptional regulator/transcriptional regulator with GAF, ATPase, and Fis domain
MVEVLASSHILTALRVVNECLGNKAQVEKVLDRVAEAIGKHLHVDRCSILLLTKENPAKPYREFSVAGDSSAPDSSIKGNVYKVTERSELFGLLQNGKSVPLKDLSTRDDGTEPHDLQHIVNDTDSKSLVVFPLRYSGQLVGCLMLHMVQSAQSFSEDVLALGEVLAEIIGMKCAEEEFLSANTHSNAKIHSHANLDSDSNSHSNSRSNSNPNLNSNSPPNGDLNGSSDKKSRIPDNLLQSKSSANAASPAASRLPAASLPMSASSSRAPGSQIDARPTQPDELVNSLSKQLSWERWVRQIICKLHATLDRDLLLQSVADGFGRSLSASRCLIVRTDGLASPVVTHEYVEADISPLGLGRTGPFPLGAILPFRHKAGAVSDVSALLTSGDLSKDEYEYFAENGVRSMAGAPIASHGTYFGVIVILEREVSRKWAPGELDMLELVASQTAVAMGHCQSYQQLKDQLFNLNLLGNLTQQLTSTLELVSRGSVKSEPSEEKVRLAMNAPPLSMRELEVLKLIASGLANREIAQRLFLTESTVELHASRIRKKLKLKSRTALVKYACDNGLA